MTDREAGRDPDGHPSGRDATTSAERPTVEAAPEQPTEQLAGGPSSAEQPTAEQPTAEQPTAASAPAEQTPTEPAEPVTPTEVGVAPDGETTVPSAERTRARRAGRIRQQDRTSTRPRPLSLGEQRAIAVAQRREDEAREAEEERATRSRRRWRRVVVVVAVFAVVVLAVVLLAAFGSNDDEVVTASCVDDRGVVVNDDLCDGSAPGAYQAPGGLVILGGNSYRYYYGGTAVPGRVAQGGSTVAPKKADVVTRSGRTIQRGGFGVGGANGGTGPGGTSAGSKSGSKSGTSGSRSGSRSSSRSGGGRKR